jgi:Rieske Fe-S protein
MDMQEPRDDTGLVDASGPVIAMGPAATIGPSRRILLAGAGAAAIAALGGCATYGQGNAPPPAEEDGPVDEPSAPASGSPGPDGQTPAPPPPLADTSDIPVGGGKVFEGKKVVVTQPQAGTFKAFSAVCTHQGCLVTEVEDGTIVCPCHGSAFKIADGSVANGPASRPLAAKKIRVEGSSIRLG